MNEDRCAACGVSIDDNLSDETTAHWDSPGGDDIAAWSCSRACAAIVEARRRPDGRLEPQGGVTEP